MPNYAYQGLDLSGKKVAGQITADDGHAAAMRVKALGIFPSDIRLALSREISGSRTVARRETGKVKSRDLTIFSRQLANLVRGGLPLMRTFSALTEHTEDPRLKTVLERMQQEIKGGKALWEALGEFPEVFPPIYVSMVKAGEASGQLASVLQWLAGYLEKEESKRTQIRSALAYPTLLISVGTITISALVTFVVPKFTGMFEEFNQALPLPTVILVGISGVVQHWWWLILLVVASLLGGLKAYAMTESGRTKIDLFRLRMPLMGKLNLKTCVSKFARTTSTLLQGGVTLFDSMNIVRDVVGNEIFAQGTDFVRDGMREGQSFAARLRESGVFPPLLTHMAAVGEETGDLQGVLLTVADAYDVEVEATLKSLISLLEPIIIVVIGSMIAFIILAMLLPVFEINMTGG